MELQGTFTSQRSAHCYRIQEMYKIFMERNQYLLDNIYIHSEGSSDQLMWYLYEYSCYLDYDILRARSGEAFFYNKLSDPDEVSLSELRRIDSMFVEALDELEVEANVPPIASLVSDLRSSAEMSDFIVLFRDTGENAGRIEDFGEKMTEYEASVLTQFERAILIENLIKGHTGNTDEKAIINIINTVPAENVESMITFLTAGKNENLKLLHSNIHGSEQKKYYMALTNLMLKRYVNRGPELFANNARAATVLPWNDPTILGAWFDNPRHYDVNFEDDGKISIQHRKVLSTSTIVVSNAFTDFSSFDEEDSGKMYFDPFDMVCVNFLSDEAHVGKAEGENYYVPAVFLLDFQQKQDIQMLRQVGDITLFSVGMLLGFGEIAAASAIWRAIAIADMIVAAGDIIIMQLRSQIMELEGGPKFLKAWDTFNTAFMIFGLGQLLYNTPEIIRNLRGLLSKRMIDAAKDAGMKLDDQLEALETLVKQSDNNPRLRSLISELDEAKRSGKISTGEELDNWLKNRVPEDQRQLFDSEAFKLLNRLDEVDVSIVRLRRNADEVRFRLSDPKVSDSSYAKIPKTHVNNGLADSIVEDIARMDDVRRQRALEIIDTRYRNGDSTMEGHHWITQKLVKDDGYDFLDQSTCGIDLIKDQRNLSMIAGHRGRHTYKASDSYKKVLLAKLDELDFRISRSKSNKNPLTNEQISTEVLHIRDEMQLGVAKGEIRLQGHDEFVILENITGSGIIH